MALQIITAEQRLAEATVKGLVFGQAGVGKTTLLKTLDPATTLCISCEGGLISVQKADQFGPAFAGDVIEPSNWLELVSITEAFKLKDRPEPIRKYRTVFIDSISVASKWCFEWCQTQPEAFSDKKTLANGQPAPNLLGAYGLLGRTMTQWTWEWKNAPGINVWMVGGLERKDNDIGGKEWRPLLMGAKLADELPYIMDYVVVMGRFKAADGNIYTGFHTDPKTEYGTVPVKARGGGFDPIEQPHLGAFMAKALGHSPVVTAPPPSVDAPDEAAA